MYISRDALQARAAACLEASCTKHSMRLVKWNQLDEFTIPSVYFCFPPCHRHHVSIDQYHSKFTLDTVHVYR